MGLPPKQNNFSPKFMACMRILTVVITVLAITTILCTDHHRLMFWMEGSDTNSVQNRTGEKLRLQYLAPSTKLDSNGKNHLDPTPAEIPAKLTASAPDSSDSFGPDTIENEFIINFDNSDDFNQFLKLARKNGIDIVDIVERWNSVRLRVTNRDQFNDLISQGPTPNDYSSNYFIRTPDLPGSSDDPVEFKPSDFEAFGDDALDWLGLENGYPFRGEDIVVAVLDTGVGDHPTFREGAIERISLLEETNGVDGDYSGHGTAVASIIGGHAADAAGVAPNAQILSVQVLDANGVGDAFTVAKGILEAVDRGADVINLSLGTYGDSPELRRAILYADFHGVPVVASVGNDGLNGISYPARYREVIAVTGIDPMGQHVPFANQGLGIDLAAPATGVQAAWNGNHIVSFSGTSASAPFVSGAIALLLSENPTLSPADAINILIDYSNDSGAPGPDPSIGNGILDIGRALNRGQQGIYDVALASHHISPESDLTLELVVSAQNRGTEILRNIRLTSVIDGVVKHTHFKNVGVGETVSQRYHVDRDKLIETGQVQIKSSVSIDGRNDSKIINNSRSSLLIIN